jgi:hypothetical protein
MGRRGQPGGQVEFIALDGEGWTLEGDHKYVLIMDSDGRRLTDERGIATKRVFDFILALPPRRVPVVFGLNYDVNMWLRDLGRARLQELWSTGRSHWFDYTLEWIPGKWFKVSKAGGRSVKVFEVFGFFQTRFVKALEDWDIPVQDVDSLEEMKASRSTFDPTMLPAMIEYCHTECKLLVRLMEGLRDALEYVDIRLRSWNGAGAIAAALLRREGVKDHLVHHGDLPPAVAQASLCAYFGGRTELFQQGRFPLVSQYDICSAYPAAAIGLQSLTTATWEPIRKYDVRLDHGLFECTWTIPPSSGLGPFPYRTRNGRICYPLNGRGWYHACEIRDARRLYGDDIQVHSGWVPRDNHPDYPFAFIPELYAYRRKLKEDGHAAQKCLKLAINSLYGKLAQGVGFRDTPPPFQSYFWAGEITARTRARMLSIAAQHPDDLIMLATDGVFFAGDVPLQGETIGNNLGDLEHGTITDAFFAQPGVYCGTKDGVVIRRSRGFFAKEIDFDSVAVGSDQYGPDYEGRYSSTRFHGLGTSLMAKDLGHWRQWVTSDRKLLLMPSMKRVLDPTARPVRHTPPRLPDDAVTSLPYTPKRGHSDDEADYRQGKDQPLR